MVFDGRPCRALVFKRPALWPECFFPGPALVCDFESTTVVPPDFSCRVDGFLNLIIEPLRPYGRPGGGRGGKA
jgi:N-methylhydantoinase A